MLRHRLLILNVIVLVAAASSLWGRQIEGRQFPHPDLFSRLQLPFRDWKPTELKLSAEELRILEPDAYLSRRYESPGREFAIQVMVIAGHRKRSVHTPNHCMATAGWDVVHQGEHELNLRGRKVWATRILLVREGVYAVDTYFFTDGEYTSPTLLPFQVRQIMQRFQSEIRLGAIARTMVPVFRDLPTAEQLSDELATATLPGALRALRQARLE